MVSHAAMMSYDIKIIYNVKRFCEIPYVSKKNEITKETVKIGNKRETCSAH